MKFTISTLISFAVYTAAAPSPDQHYSSYESSSNCIQPVTITKPAETVTRTVTVRPHYTPINNVKYPSGNHGGRWTPGHYGGGDKPKPDPEMPATVTVIHTKWHGHGKPPTYQTSTCTNSYTTSVVTKPNGTPSTSTVYYPPPAATYTVTVGGKDAAGKPKLIYTPEVVFAKKGDTVIYDFLANNHTLTESTFDVPCEAKVDGPVIKSGFRPNFNNTVGANQFAVTLADENVHWFYCGQADHCEKGMVHAINPPTSGPKTFAAFVKKATSGLITPPTGGNSTIPEGNSTVPVYGSKTIKINVGGGDDPAKPLLKFTEPISGAQFIDAKAGDRIDFTFLRNMHSVTESTFTNPCTPKGNSTFMPTGPIKNTENAVDAEKFVRSFTVPADNNGAPIWFYCGVADHCNKGMVFAINPGNKFDQFVANAAADIKSKTLVMAPKETESTSYGSYY
ncbi:hypothetical protein EDC01DRAFT_215697 [Geopyxis carbonaria]|nr:hypothetical protein EDC01DRAFT_215697 [Geopyxis carbonaria]